MSNFELEYVTCPVCRGQKTSKIYKEVDTSENKKLRNKILNDELFRFRCSNCGYEDQNNYPFLYTDLEDKLLVWHIPSISGKSIEDIVEEINTENKLEEKENKEFCFRAVKNLNELKEKIILRNLNLDDINMEVVKLFYLNSIMLSEEPLDINKLFGIYFNVNNGQWQLCFAMEDEENKIININEETYNEVKVFSRDVVDEVLSELNYNSNLFSYIGKELGEKVMFKLLEKNGDKSLK